MNKRYDVVIGIEVHLELKTKTKCFSAAPNTFDQKPNSQTSPVDCGYPGTLPTINQEVVISAIKLAHVLQMKIDHHLRFDRKNYFYPDLPKGYQITQFYHPIGTDGILPIELNDGSEFIVEFERVHIEEDTAKQIHLNDKTLLDYNRAGIPLLELVTKPIFNHAEQVIAYLTNLRRILLALDISDAKMNEGSLRCDINLSLKPVGSTTLGTKVEIKNLNSFNNITLAINSEINRQSELLATKQQITPQTRRFDEKTKTTILMREKKQVVDYKYFPEPNIFPISLSEAWVNNIITTIPLMPHQISQHLEKTYQLNREEINFLLEHQTLIPWFEEVAKNTKQVKMTINFLLGPIQAILNLHQQTDIVETKLTVANLSELIILMANDQINDRQMKKLLETIYLDNSKTPQQWLTEWGEKLIVDESAISNMITTLFEQNPDMVLQFSQNPVRANKFFMGQLMKQTKGQLNAKMAQKIMQNLINKINNQVKK